MKPHFLNTGMKGQEKGWSKTSVAQVPRYRWLPWWTKKTIYELSLHEDPAKRFTFVTSDERFIQPPMQSLTDDGSVPALAQLLIPKDRFLIFYIHDPCCTYGGLFVSRDYGKTYHYETFTMAQCDALLIEGVKGDPYPGGSVQACAIWSAVVAATPCRDYGKGDAWLKN